jgi:hypothetical protein
VLIGQALWEGVFGSDPAVIDRLLIIGGREHSVVGVLPRRFRGVDQQTVDAWILLAQSPELCSFTGSTLLASSRGSWLRTIGRLREEATIELARAEVARG